jgi:hypothetical protein
MLMLLVAPIPELRVGETAHKMAASLVIGAMWIGVISWMAGVIRKAIVKHSGNTKAPGSDFKLPNDALDG